MSTTIQPYPRQSVTSSIIVQPCRLQSATLSMKTLSLALCYFVSLNLMSGSCFAGHHATSSLALGYFVNHNIISGSQLLCQFQPCSWQTVTLPITLQPHLWQSVTLPITVQPHPWQSVTLPITITSSLAVSYFANHHNLVPGSQLLYQSP